MIERVKHLRDMTDYLCKSMKITDDISDADCRKTKEDDYMMENGLMFRNKEV